MYFPSPRVSRPVLCGDGVEVLVVEVTLPFSVGPTADTDFAEVLSLANDEPTFIVAISTPRLRG